ncbi:MAG: hypothetical protein ACI9YH_001018 [Colwellia sp.]|jgi:hypothetical protein
MINPQYSIINCFKLDVVDNAVWHFKIKIKNNKLVVMLENELFEDITNDRCGGLVVCQGKGKLGLLNTINR